MTTKRSGRGVQEVFLSHASKDRKMASRLAEALRANHVPVWYSQTNLLPAQQWHDEIGHALGRCGWFLILLSPAAVKSRWVKRELFYALSDQRYDNQIIPILYRQCDARPLSWTLSAYQFVDFTGTFDDGCRTLLKTWGVKYRSTK